MTVDSHLINHLIQSEDPLAVIWRHMEQTYRVEHYPEDLRGFMEDREESLNRLEQVLYDGFFEIYDQLLEVAQAQDRGYVLSLLSQSSLVIIADSLSVREAILLETLSKEGRWQAKSEGFSVAPFPPTTATLSESLLGTPSPAQGRDRTEFRYRYVAGPEQIPQMPSSGPLLVWIRLPDTALEKVTVAQTDTVADAFRKAVDALDNVLTLAGREQALVTSDHGYLYARSPTQYWRMPRSIEEAASSAFRRARRVQSVSQEHARGLRDHESPHDERRYFCFSHDHVALRGRYWWGTGRQNERCTAHGGLSFVECLVPVLRIWKR